MVLGEDLGLIDKAGAWYTCVFMEDQVQDYDEKNYKFQGQAKLYEYIASNQDIFKILENKVKEMLV